MAATALRFAVLAAVVRTAANFGDHFIQIDNDANGPADATPGTAGKAASGPKGWAACTRHVTTYTATIGAATLAASTGLGLRLRPGRVAAGLAIIAGTHWIIDRRAPLRWVAEHTGHRRFVKLGLPRKGLNPDGRPYDDNPTLGTGMYALDQAAHDVFNLLGTAVMASGRRHR